jgi:hypothetical protein
MARGDVVVCHVKKLLQLLSRAQANVSSQPFVIDFLSTFPSPPSDTIESISSSDELARCDIQSSALCPFHTVAIY